MGILDFSLLRCAVNVMLSEHTWICHGNSSSPRKITRARCHALPLVVAVEGIGSVGLQSVGQIAESIQLNGGAVSPSPTCIIQCSLQHVVADVASCHTPTGSPVCESSHYRGGYEPQGQRWDDPRRGRGSHGDCGVTQMEI